MKDKEHLERLGSMKQGDCDFCGEHSAWLVDGICPKQICQRYKEENKPLCGEAWLNGEYEKESKE